MTKEILATAFAVAITAICEATLFAAALAIMLRQYERETEVMFARVMEGRDDTPRS